MLSFLNKILRGFTNSKIKNYTVENGNEMDLRGSMYNLKFNIKGEKNTVVLKESSHLQNLKIYISGQNNTIIIEESVSIKSGVLWIEDNNNRIQIGKGTTIEGAHISVTENDKKILIGKDCMISHDVIIRNGDSHSIIDLETKRRINYAKDVIIEDHVWVGAFVKILKGVVINSNSVIGFNSLVTKNVKSNVIVAGTPAKVLKENIDWKRERIYDKD